MGDQAGPVTTSEQQAVPVAQEKLLELCTRVERFAWLRDGTGDMDSTPHLLAHAVRALLAVSPALPCKSGEGAGLNTVSADMQSLIAAAKGRPGLTISEWVAKRMSDAADAALTPDATQTREAELVAALNKIADLGSCANGKTPAYKLFQQAIDIATGAL